LRYYLKAGAKLGSPEMLDDLIALIPKRPSLIYLVCRDLGFYLSDVDDDFYEANKTFRIKKAATNKKRVADGQERLTATEEKKMEKDIQEKYVKTKKKVETTDYMMSIADNWSKLEKEYPGLLEEIHKQLPSFVPPPPSTKSTPAKKEAKTTAAPKAKTTSPAEDDEFSEFKR